jgi:AcrR family transcriptional regulator
MSMSKGEDRPTRLTPKGLAMRGRIVEAAADLAFRSGAHETSLDEVRHQVGASKSQLYHYFADKDELLAAVIDHQGLRVRGAQQPELGAIDSWQTMKRWRDKLVRLAEVYGTEGGCPVGSLGNELATHSPVHRASVSEQFDLWAAEIDRALAAMQARGLLAPDCDPKQLSQLFLSAIQGGLLFAKIHGTAAVLATALDQLIAVLQSQAPTGVSGRARATP